MKCLENSPGRSVRRSGGSDHGSNLSGSVRTYQPGNSNDSGHLGQRMKRARFISLFFLIGSGKPGGFFFNDSRYLYPVYIIIIIRHSNFTNDLKGLHGFLVFCGARYYRARENATIKVGRVHFFYSVNRNNTFRWSVSLELAGTITGRTWNTSSMIVGSGGLMKTLVLISALNLFLALIKNFS